MAESPHHFTDPDKRGSGRAISPDALFGLIGDDEVIRSKTRLLVNMILENAFNVMLHGTTADRIALSRSLMPGIVKMLSADVEGGVDALRAQMMKMFQQMSGGEVLDEPEAAGPPPAPPPL